jgi:Gram-negative bacterial TonB protein C-terminal/Tetratricopeptide repeat
MKTNLLPCFVFLMAISISLNAQQPAPAPAAPVTTPPPVIITAQSEMTQGVALYKKGKFDLAAKKFQAAVKLEPNNDEALGYAALTAFQLGNMAQARDFFQRRTDLPKQKNSIKTYSNYMIGMTRWRQAHEIIIKRGELIAGKTTYKLADKEILTANEHINAGLASIKKSLTIKPDYSEALNLLNLLNAEAAALATDESKAEELRKSSLHALSQALKSRVEGTKEAADFGAPTIRLGEFSVAVEDVVSDEMTQAIAGGSPLNRVSAVLPYIKVQPKSKAAPVVDSGPNGAALSAGPGQGALKASTTQKAEVIQLKGGKAKVEVLISSLGKVMFARMIDGPPATTTPAINAAKKWTFLPATFEGKPVQVSGVITFNVKSSTKEKPKTKPEGKPATAPKKT